MCCPAGHHILHLRAQAQRQALGRAAARVQVMAAVEVQRQSRCARGRIG